MTGRARLLIPVLLLLCAVPGLAQTSGPGSTGGQILQLPAGARAAGLGGAYTTATDADALFYNPAGVADLAASVSLSYQAHVEDISLGTGAATFRFGRFALGASASFITTGSIVEVVPDPEFGGQRGRPTGEHFSAGETALRIHTATILGDRLSVGTGIGVVTSDMGGLARSATLLDLGMQLAIPRMPRLTVGAALRHLGGSLRGTGAEPAPLPTEARAGLAFRVPLPADAGASLHADLISPLREGGVNLATGVEFKVPPRPGHDLGIVARLGFNNKTIGQDWGSPFQFGAGIYLAELELDYSVHNLEHFGPVHRFGIRWTGR